MMFNATEICRALERGNMPRLDAKPVASTCLSRNKHGEWGYTINLDTEPYCAAVIGEDEADEARALLGEAELLLEERGYQLEENIPEHVLGWHLEHLIQSAPETVAGTMKHVL